jgi:1,2-diacylglycerol 3-alpha-glucosyltransferase
MRILMISDVYFPRINGVSTSIQSFRQELEALGHEVFLIAPEYPTPFVDDIRLFRIPARGVILDPEDRMMRFRDITSDMLRWRQLRPDIVHIHTPFVAHYAGQAIARALGVPSVCTYHTLFEEYLYHYIPWLPKSLLRLCARRFSVSQCNQVSGVIAPSSVIVNLLKGYGVRRRMQILPTGIDSTLFATGNGTAFRERLGIPVHHKVLLNVSRIAFEKNIGLLLEMFADLHARWPDTHLVIAGEGPARKACMEQANALRLQDNISFVGYLDRRAELADCYHAADLFVFASRTETQGLVLLEAMAAGLPVVSIAAMGTVDVLKQGEGASITDGSVRDFSDRVSALLQDPARLQNLSHAAVRYAGTWDSHQCALRMLAFYHSLLPDAAPLAASAPQVHALPVNAPE